MLKYRNTEVVKVYRETLGFWKQVLHNVVETLEGPGDLPGQLPANVILKNLASVIEKQELKGKDNDGQGLANSPRRRRKAQ